MTVTTDMIAATVMLRVTYVTRSMDLILIIATNMFTVTYVITTMDMLNKHNCIRHDCNNGLDFNNNHDSTLFMIRVTCMVTAVDIIGITDMTTVT